MSVNISAMVFARYPVGGNEYVLALALADHAHDDGTHIYAGLASLAKKSRQSEAAVRRQLKVMQYRGWLWLVRKATGRPGAPNVYRINPAWVAGADLPVMPLTEQNEIIKFLGSQGDAETGCTMQPVSDDEPVDNPVDEETETGCIGAETGCIGVERGCIAVLPEPSGTIKNQIPPYPPAGGGDGFDEFKTQYPKTADEDKARRRWRRMAPDAALQAQILAAVKRLRLTPQWRADAARYVPSMAAFLRNRRWADAATVPWPDGRADVEALGEALGVGRWDMAAWQEGRGFPFAAYEHQVRAAVDKALGVLDGPH